MARLSRKRKFPPPSEDNDRKRIGEISVTESISVIRDRRIFQYQVPINMESSWCLELRIMAMETVVMNLLY